MPILYATLYKRGMLQNIKALSLCVNCGKSFALQGYEIKQIWLKHSGVFNYQTLRPSGVLGLPRTVTAFSATAA